MTAVLERREADETLVERAKTGHRDAFGALVDRYGAALAGMLLDRLHDPESAEEAAQSALVKAFESIGSFQGRSSFKTWLWRIALNEAWLRRRSQRRHGAVALDESALGAVAGAGGNETADLERRLDLEGALQALSPRERETCLWRLEGYSLAEIAARLGISEGTVKSTQFTAVRKIRRLLRRSAAARNGRSAWR